MASWQQQRKAWLFFVHHISTAKHSWMWFLKSLMKTSSLGLELQLVRRIRGDKLIQGPLKSSTFSHGQTGSTVTPGWEAKGLPLLPLWQQPTPGPTWAHTAEHGSLGTQVFQSRVIPLLVPSNWHWNKKFTYSSQTLLQSLRFCRKFHKTGS